MENGAFLVYVESKTLPSDEEFEKIGQAFGMFYELRKKQSVYNAFLRSLMAASASAKE